MGSVQVSALHGKPYIRAWVCAETGLGLLSIHNIERSDVKRVIVEVILCGHPGNIREHHVYLGVNMVGCRVAASSNNWAHIADRTLWSAWRHWHPLLPATVRKQTAP